MRCAQESRGEVALLGDGPALAELQRVDDRDHDLAGERVGHRRDRRLDALPRDRDDRELALLRRGDVLPGGERALGSASARVAAAWSARSWLREPTMISWPGRGEVDREATPEVAGTAEDRDLHLVTRLPFVGLAGPPPGGVEGVLQQVRDGHGADAPGHRREPARDLAGLVARDVARRPASVRLMPTSMTAAPGLIQSPRIICGRPTAATSTSAARHSAGRSRVRECATVTVALRADQQQRHRLADDQAAPTTTRPAPSSGDAGAVEQPHHAARRAGHRARLAAHQAAEVDRREPVHVLVGVDAVGDQRPRRAGRGPGAARASRRPRRRR